MSRKLVEQIKRHEGFRARPYKCTAGKNTVGYGRNLDDVGITKTEAMELLENDLHNVEVVLSDHDFYSNLSCVDDVRCDVVVNMAFNMGVAGLLKFQKMIAAIERKHWNQAATEMLNSRWAKQVPSRANELAEQMRTGEYQQ